jgi:hypothetical protein
MIDELVLEQLLAELGEEIAVPADGAEQVAHELRTSARPVAGVTPRFTHLAMVAAAVLVLVGVGVLIHNATKTSTSSTALAPVAGSAAERQLPLQSKSTATKSRPAVHGVKGAFGAPGSQGLVGNDGPQGGIGPNGAAGATGPQGPAPTGPVGAPNATATGSSPATGASASALVDGAMIVKNASLELQVPKGDLPAAVIRVTHIANGVSGYVSKSNTSFSGPDPTAAISIRVPVNSFESTVKQLETFTGVKVLSDNESGVDVTAQYVNLTAKMNADIGERDSLLTLLANANNLGDILTLRDRITSVQADIDQMQGQLNVLSNQSTFSAISVLLSVQPPATPKPAAVHHVSPPTGLEKSWNDARQGFANSVEWFIARSGGALIILLIGLLLAFALRYLYPVVRRALL